MNTFIGEIKALPFSRIPENWMPCAGQILAISDYQQLYSLLGKNFGGNGTTTFALPDLRGRTVIGAGIFSKNYEYAFAQKGGLEEVTLSVAQMGKHTHTLTAYNDMSTSMLKAPETYYLGLFNGRHSEYVADGYTVYKEGETVNLNENSISNTGGGLPHSNMMPYAVLTYCIATKGAYPTND